MASNPDIIRGRPCAAGMSGIADAARLDEQQLDLMLGVRLVLDPLRQTNISPAES
jgi:hypothetical protein